MFRRLLVLGLAFSIILSEAKVHAQETPTRVDIQNRSGDLPFSTSIGTDVEHVDMATGDLVVHIPIAHVNGRGMDYDYALNWMGKFLVVNQRVNIFGNPVQQWALEPSGNTIAGTWTDNSTKITFASILTKCTTSNQVIYTHYIYTDPSGAKHRFFLDTSEVRGLGHAILWSNNYFTVSRGAAYGLTDGDSAVVICLRHESAPFAFTDAMWAKYGSALSGHAAFVDPKTKQPASINVFQATGYNELLTSRGTTLATIIGHGVGFAVCTLATRGIAGEAARATGGKVDDIFKELTDNRIANTHMVPAGIVAVNRAQERGYSISSVS